MLKISFEIALIRYGFDPLLEGSTPSSQAIATTARNSSSLARCIVPMETWPATVSALSSRGETADQRPMPRLAPRLRVSRTRGRPAPGRCRWRWLRGAPPCSLRRRLEGTGRRYSRPLLYPPHQLLALRMRQLAMSACVDGRVPFRVSFWDPNERYRSEWYSPGAPSRTGQVACGASRGTRNSRAIEGFD